MVRLGRRAPRTHRAPHPRRMADMTPENARSVVLGSGALIAAGSVVSDLHADRTPSLGVPLGAGLLTTMLAAVSGIAPTAAAGIALLAVFGAAANLVRSRQ